MRKYVLVIACSRDGTAKLWNCGRGECDSTLIDCGSVINACAIGPHESATAPDGFQPDGKYSNFQFVLMLTNKEMTVARLISPTTHDKIFIGMRVCVYDEFYTHFTHEKCSFRFTCGEKLKKWS